MKTFLPFDTAPYPRQIPQEDLFASMHSTLHHTFGNIHQPLQLLHIYNIHLQQFDLRVVLVHRLMVVTLIFFDAEQEFLGFGFHLLLNDVLLILHLKNNII
jgi:hypothetical protein